MKWYNIPLQQTAFITWKILKHWLYNYISIWEHLAIQNRDTNVILYIFSAVLTSLPCQSHKLEEKVFFVKSKMEKKNLMKWRFGRNRRVYTMFNPWLTLFGLVHLNMD